MNNPPKIVTIESKKLVGHAIEMSLVNNKTFELFSGFMPQKIDIQNTVSQDVYEVLMYDSNYFKNFNPTNTFIKWATVEVENYDAIPKGMSTLDLNSDLYAVFYYKGLPQNFGTFMSYIYTNWIPKSQYKLDQRPHFNLLTEKTKRNSPDSEETVWIPIAPK